jgi:hypothetical protein
VLSGFITLAKFTRHVNVHSGGLSKRPDVLAAPVVDRHKALLALYGIKSGMEMTGRVCEGKY